MRVKQHASGSNGNFYEIKSCDNKRLLIDIGLSWQNMQRCLNYDLTNIVAAFAGHLHADHFKEPEKVLQAGIDLYASKETLEHKNLLGARRTHVISDKTLVKLDGFQVFCFGVEHDCEGCLGFVVREDATGDFLLYVTDTAFIAQKFPYPWKIIMIECSYDKEILTERVESGDINETLAKRLLSSHMEKQNTIRYLDEFCDLSKCKEIHLLHMSTDNIDKEKTRTEIEERFFITTRTVEDGLQKV